MLFTVASIVKFLLGRSDELTSDLVDLPADVRKQARKLRQDGDLLGAANSLRDAGAFDLAASCFLEANMPERAAESFEKADMLLQAIQIYEELGDIVRAGELHGELGAYTKAAEHLMASGQELQAAEFLSRAGDFERAAAIFIKRQQFIRAAKCFQDANDPPRQMELLERQFHHDFKAVRGELSMIESSRQLARMAGTFYIKNGQLRRGAKLLVQAGFTRETAKALADLGHPIDAAKLAEKHGHTQDAIKYYTAGGAKQQAVKLQAAAATQAGDPERAAALHAKIGDFERAAALFEEANKPAQAAEQLVRAKEYERAGELFERAGALQKAARCFEAARLHERAADIHAQLGDLPNELKNLAAAGLWLRVGRHLIAQQQFPDALKALQSLEPEHNDFSEARELLGDIHMHNKMAGPALRSYQDATRAAPDALDNVALLYKIARCFESLNRNTEAVKTYRRIITLDPTYRDVQARLLAFDPPASRRSSYGNTSAARAPTSHPATDSPPGARFGGAQPRIGKTGIFKTGRASAAIRKRGGSSGGGSGVRVSRTGRHPVPDAPVPADIGTGRTPLESFARDPSRLTRQSSINQPNASSSPDVEETLRYEIIDEIARGGMGVVYKARDTVLSRIVAYKILSEALKNNKMAVEYFIREARASAKLNHNNIVTVFDAGAQAGEYYMAMEYIEGRTLKDLVARQGPFPEKLVRYLLVHACRGLHYAHDRAIVHRDIKGGNMMLTTSDRQLKIMDFGLAKVMSEVRRQDQNDTRAVGTPFYMSPEQILGTEIDRRSDIYSLGVTFFELATGTVPFFKGDVTYHHVHSPPPSPRSLNPGISELIEHIILKSMAKRPEDRYATCDEIIRELK